jgi:predicted DCC family thiol-disulfide oxidoreductase YuxK
MMRWMDAAAYHIFYDGTCVLCRRSKAWLERRDVNRRFAFVDSRDADEMGKWPAVGGEETTGRMVVVGPRGEKRGGYDGVVMLMGALPRWTWFAPVMGACGVRSVGRWVYRRVARNRYRLFGRVECEAGVCRV